MRGPSYINLVLKNAVVEERSESFLSHKAQIDLLQLLTVIQRAARSPRVKALVLVIKNVSVGWAQIEEIHAALDDFHRAGKRSLAFLEQGDNRTYYLAAGAQQVYLPPSGGVELVGLRAEVFFFKNVLDYLGIEPEIYSLGEYKSAGEIFNREQMSEASRRMSTAILTDVQDQLVRKVSEARRVTPEQVQAWIDNGPYTARKALDHGLVDGLAYEDQMKDLVARQLPGAAEFPVSRLEKREGFVKRLVTFNRPQIAYLVAEGLIVPGESRRGRAARTVIGSDTVIGLLREARENKRVRAVVLRLNSPGGSALASDLIWREVKLTNEKKPVVVSFSNVSASGGYYIAVAGRRILSMPATLTGSIGVLGGKFNLQRLIEKLGITVDSVERGARSGYASLTRPFSDSEEQVVIEQMREFYEELFLKKVAEGRKREVADIREIAEGRVWTGNQAIQNGLVDEKGGIRRALELAREEAGLAKDRKIRLVRFARKRRWLDFLPFPLFEAHSAFRLHGPLFLMLEDFDIR